MLSRSRRNLLARLRCEWGAGRVGTRRHDFTAIADYHRSRLDDSAPRSLDDRTWDDLNLNDVFAASDRTESTLGQQSLYHRLRTAPTADDLDAFEALVTRLTTDAPAREQAQIALARLRDPRGYDLWWLGQPDAPHTRTRPWHALFPVFTVIIWLALALIPVWPAAIFIPLAAVVINLNLRIATARRVGSLLGPFRQLGPLLAAATALARLVPSAVANNDLPNSIRLAPPPGVLVTGSNMSGKSTFLRTVGVNAVLAQTINTCFAEAYEAPVYHVKSCIGRSDDLIAGKSYYIAEVEAVLGLVRASTATAPHLFLFDELFRGTNAVERIAAAEAVLTELLKPRDSRATPLHVVLTATHDAELIDLLRDTYAPYHFTDTLGPDGLTFEHRLMPGPATTRNAIALLELYGAPAALVGRALARAADLDDQRRLISKSS